MHRIKIVLLSSLLFMKFISQVGDIVHLSCNEIIPADIVLLNSSDDEGICYAETSSLDGETNLKQRMVTKVSKQSTIPFYQSFNQSFNQT